MIHIGIFNTSGDVQTALDRGKIKNPYVALVDGDLDYNSLEPTPEPEPCYLGEWSDDGAGTYTFQILEPGDAVWENGVNIGSLMNVYFNGGQDTIDMDVTLTTMPGSGVWTMNFVADPEESANPNYGFEEGVADAWESGVMTNPNDSDAVISVDWDGTDTFVLNTASDLHPLSMTTINPECSE